MRNSILSECSTAFILRFIRLLSDDKEASALMKSWIFNPTGH